MVTANDPLACFSGAGEFGDYIVKSLETPVGFDAEMDLRWARAQVISDGETTAPRSWS